MRHMLRNDDVYTVTVEYVPTRQSFRCEVFTRMDVIVAHEYDEAEHALELASQFVNGHISSRYLWALVADRDEPPRIQPKSPAYTEACRQKVDAHYKRDAA